MILIGGLIACSKQNPGMDTGAVSVVKKYLEAEKNNDYESWKAALWSAQKNGQNFSTSFEKPGDLGVISLTIGKVEVSDKETEHIKKRYYGSELAKSNGWSDEYISQNMVAVSAKYTVDYDNTKVPYDEGNVNQYFYLVRDSKDSPWLIWDTGGMAN